MGEVTIHYHNERQLKEILDFATDHNICAAILNVTLPKGNVTVHFDNEEQLTKTLALVAKLKICCIIKEYGENGWKLKCRS